MCPHTRPLQCPVFPFRHPTGGSFVRPAKVSFGVDYLSAVHQVYQVNLEEVLSEASAEQLEWKIEEGKYVARLLTVAHMLIWRRG